MDWSIYDLKVVWWYFSFFFQFFFNSNRNSGDAGQSFHLVLHCLPMSRKKDARLILLG